MEFFILGCVLGVNRSASQTIPYVEESEGIFVVFSLPSDGSENGCLLLALRCRFEAHILILRPSVKTLR